MRSVLTASIRKVVHFVAYDSLKTGGCTSRLSSQFTIAYSTIDLVFLYGFLWELSSFVRAED